MTFKVARTRERVYYTHALSIVVEGQDEHIARKSDREDVEDVGQNADLRLVHLQSRGQCAKLELELGAWPAQSFGQRQSQSV